MSNNKLILRATLLASGFDDREIARLRKAGLVQVRPGAYLEKSAASALTGREKHLMLIDAARARSDPSAVVSHISAAMMLNIAEWNVPLDVVHLTRSRRNGSRTSKFVKLHSAPLRPAQIREVRGALVTSPARTVIDIARTIGFTEAVIIADSALFKGLVTEAELEEELNNASGWPGARAARRVIAFSNRLSESAGESRSRVLMNLLDLPQPTLQHEVVDCYGDFIGRSDFYWKEFELLGEFDGLQKYGRSRRPGEEIGDVVIREKLREDELRRDGYGVVRWIWSEFSEPELLRQKLLRSMDGPTGRR